MLENREYLFVLMIKNDNNFKNDKLFKDLFNNMIIVNNIEDAKKVLEYNHIDIIMCEHSKNIDAFNFFQNNKNETILKFVLTKEINSDDLLKSIELKIDAYLIESSDDKKLIKQITTPIESYLNKNTLFFEKYFDNNKEEIIVVKTDLKGTITYSNDLFSEVSLFDKKDIIGKKYNIVKSILTEEKTRKTFLKDLHKSSNVSILTLKNKDKNGKEFYLKSIIKTILNEKKEIINYVSFSIKVNNIETDKKLLLEDIEVNDLSVLSLINVIEYKILEKFYSKDLLDKLIRFFIKILEKEIKKFNIFKKIYSIGNGKFAILSSFFDFEKSKFTLEEYFNTLVKNINKEILEIDGTSYDLNILLSYSFGKHKLFEDTLHGLEEAIVENKTVHNSNDASLRGERKELDNKITQMVQIALDNYKIIPYFQAIVNNKTKKIEKYESLVRLIDENNKVVSPFYFLNVSKKSGYYSKITHRVLENSFKIASQINTNISINLSILDIEKENTRKFIYSLLIKYSEYTSNIIFELLEDEAAKDDKLIKNFIRKVKKTGIKIALDDFGSGYSSFERVLLYEPDIIKIDGSLVKNIESSESSRHLVETIVMFAKKQNIVTIAEYVENENIFNILRDIGVDYSQGYYFGKPEDLFFK